MGTAVRVGVVGCGYWGPNLIRNFRALRACELVAVADKDQDRLRHVQDLHPGVQAFTEFDRLLNGCNLDAVVIATPVRFHFPLATRALEQGKHVFIEKPMAASAAECEQLLDLATRNKLTLMVGHTFLYAPAVRMVKELAGLNPTQKAHP